MTRIDLISSEWNNIVFEGRNKEYGAYLLRESTGKRNLIAMMSLAFIAMACQLIISIKNLTEDKSSSRVTRTEVYEMTALAKPKEDVKVNMKQIDQEPKRVIDNVRNSIKFTTPRILKDNLVNPEDELKTQVELIESKTLIGSFDVTGGSDSDGEVMKSHDAIAQPEPKKVEDNTEFINVEQMPSFPGGDTALMEYLSKNVKYPVIAIETGVYGRVVISFLVERDGSITDVKVMKSVDASLDKEAVRVISGMPKWIAGMQNGRKVRVRYTVPVSFKLQ